MKKTTAGAKIRIGETTVLLRPRAQARRVTLRVSATDGQVSLTFPTSFPRSEAIAFARQKEAWIAQQAARNPAPKGLVAGSELPVEGVTHRIEIGAGGVRQEDGVLYTPGPEHLIGSYVSGYLRVLAHDRLRVASDFYAAKLGRPYTRITLRDTKSRWGSCSAQGRLMFSWRLILAPKTVLNYVAAHEVAHLAQMNHSPKFWAQVERLYGPYGPARDWLKQHGTSLHRYNFGAER